VVLPPLLVLDAAVTDYGPPVTVWGVLAAVAGCLPLVLRARLPFLALAPVITAGILLVLWALEPGNTVVLIPVVALADYAAAGDRRRSLWMAVAVIPCVVVSIVPFADDHGDLLELVVRNTVICFLAIAVGDVAGARRDAVRRLVAVREEQAQRRLSEERLAIAREVHDVVAHAMVAINVQAGVAAHLLERDPEHARAALRDIKAASGSALADLRATLAVLRGGAEEGGTPTRPVAGLADLEDLTAGLRAAGVRVDLDVGALPALSPAVDAAAYRIVQEALTNVLRHAGACAVRVRVAQDGGDLRLEVVDDGAGAGGGNGGGAGHGLRGMRERAAVLGGEVVSGPAPEGGWRVLARLPAGAPAGARA
jgi:signal transduction histidine kinase